MSFNSFQLLFNAFVSSFSIIFNSFLQLFASSDYNFLDPSLAIPIALYRPPIGPPARSGGKMAGPTGPKNRQNWPKNPFFTHFWANFPIFRPIFFPFSRWGQNPFFGHFFSHFGQFLPIFGPIFPFFGHFFPLSPGGAKIHFSAIFFPISGRRPALGSEQGNRDRNPSPRNSCSTPFPTLGPKGPKSSSGGTKGPQG